MDVLTASIINRALVSFFTTDAMSGIDHYEVGIIDTETSPSESPLFVEARSPYQLPDLLGGNMRVIIRAIDRVGNVRDESLDIHVPFSSKVVFGAILFVILLLILFHFLFGHHIINRLKRAYAILFPSS
ncbi:MAG: hypothetical protein ABH822_01385 [Patescibacteria group bacterium]